MWGWELESGSCVPEASFATLLCPAHGALTPSPRAKTARCPTPALFPSVVGRSSVCLSVYCSNINLCGWMCLCISWCKRECSLLLLRTGLEDPGSSSEPSPQHQGLWTGVKGAKDVEEESGKVVGKAGHFPSRVVCVRGGQTGREPAAERTRLPVHDARVSGRTCLSLSAGVSVGTCGLSLGVLKGKRPVS